MRIGINGRFLASEITGVQRYAHELLKEFVPLAIGNGHQCVVLASKNGLQNVDFECELKALPSVGDAGVLGHAWEQLVLPLYATGEKCAVMLNLCNTSSLAFPGNIVVIHDMAWRVQPAWFRPSFVLAYRTLVESGARGASRLITVSEFSRGQIEKYLGVQPNEIAIVPDGVSTDFVAPVQLNSFLARLGIDEPYFLVVAADHPRKNIKTVLKAHAQLKEKMPACPGLICVGGKPGLAFATSDCRPSASVRSLGYVPEPELQALYAGAIATISASFYEGFGLTLLESMACGTPVIASDIPAHRAVVENGGLFFEASDHERLQVLMEMLSKDPALHADLTAAALSRASAYSWNKSAKLLLEVVETSGNAS